MTIGEPVRRNGMNRLTGIFGPSKRQLTLIPSEVTGSNGLLLTIRPRSRRSFFFQVALLILLAVLVASLQRQMDAAGTMTNSDARDYLPDALELSRNAGEWTPATTSGLIEFLGTQFDGAEHVGMTPMWMFIPLALVFGLVSRRPDPTDRMVNAGADSEVRHESSVSVDPPTDVELIAHELQTALTAIQRFIEVGEMSDPSDVQSRVLRGIRHESESLGTLIRDLHAIAGDHGHGFVVRPRVCSIRELLSPMMVYSQSSEGGHQVTLLIEHEANVRADPERIGQVLRNLLSNATKYSPAGCEILVRAFRQGRRMVIEVIDEGFGIPADDVERIFQPFERGRHRDKYPGLGLGLYISDFLVRLHGAQLVARVDSDIGTVFSFSLEISE